MDYEATLNKLYQRLHDAERFEDVIWELEQDLLRLMRAERMTIYQKDRNGSEIVSWYKSGDDGVGEIRLPLTPTSLAGYVAMSHQPLIIDDVYDTEALLSIHPELRFDYSYDQTTGFLTTAMLVCPIEFKDTILGVLQLINKTDGTVFSDDDLKHAQEVAQIIGQKFRYDLKTTIGPYDALIRSGRLSLEELEECEERAREENVPVTYLLTESLNIPPEEIGQSLEQFYQVPFFHYNPELEIQNEVLENLNAEYLASAMWIPLAVTPDKAIILIDDPNDGDRIMEIQTLISAARYEFVVGLQEDILRFLGFEVGTATEEIKEPEMGLDDLVGQLSMSTDLGDESEGADLVDENASTVVQLVNRIIYDGVSMNASDIHVEPSKGRTPGVIRMRVDGECRIVLEVPATHMRPVLARIKVMSRLDIAEKRLPQSGKMTVRIGASRLELRVETVPTVNGESAVMRILAQGGVLPFDKLNFAPKNEEFVERMLTHPHGILLVVGPTGSGKTTTLHALLGKINTPERKILTAEDPVEITQHGLQQLQMMPKIGLTFATALRSFLRADPDVILIGEMRDYETAHAGIEASLTGHLVFSTLHTNSAPETITRLLDMGLDPMNFSDAFVGVVAQRLIRTLCKECKEEYKPEDDEIERLVHLYGEDYFPEIGVAREDIRLCRPPSGGDTCPKCGGTGYKGRTGVHEVAIATPALKKLIIGKAPVSDLREQAMKDGLRTLSQDGIRKIIMGQTDLIQLRKITASD